MKQEAEFPSEEDIFEALEDLPGYLDITPADLRKLYSLAWRHAVERLYRGITVRDRMTRDVLVLRPAITIGAAATAMAARGVSGAPVVDEDSRVVGVLSEKDILRQLLPDGRTTSLHLIARALQEDGLQAVERSSSLVMDIMTSPAITVSEETPLVKLAGLFRQQKINRLPVTDEEGRLVGIVSRADLLQLAMGGIE